MSDLINRAEAIEWVQDVRPQDPMYHYYKHIAVEALESVPSAEAVQGEWIKMPNGNIECSECKHQKGWYDNFCGFCGARMME